MGQFPVHSVVIAGAGQAAVQAVTSLRAGGYAGAITMIGAEPVAPYQRPPLSKAYLSGAMSLERVVLKPVEALVDEGVTFIPDTRVLHLDRMARTVQASDATMHGYDALIIATGSHVRKLPVEGADLDGVHYLRSVTDADGLRPELVAGRKMVVIGGGYIGLEVAAVARKAAMEVTVVEAMPRVLARVTTPQVSAFYEALHRAEGVTILTGTGVVRLTGAGRVDGVVLDDGRVLSADAVVVGIGIIPHTDLAADADLDVDNGISTDEDARTSDPRIFAIGDCASRPLVHYHGRRARLESVHNALEQAKLAAAAILGQPRPVVEPPWFWSDQYDVKLQTAGLSGGAAMTIIRGDRDARRFAAFHLDGDSRLLAVDAINAPPEFVVGKQLIARGSKVAPEKLGDMSVSMKQIAADPH
ncbi:MAG: FAD-dependent oxidoreductase [Hyphomonadaceae bacterium]|jgi:3-phenylpropionate/trans-cinnamate dioxygenase ferredoxin reductase subunit|nr:FAD-dependent oxidoreductase [Hyphomonadaceae bacterium]